MIRINILEEFYYGNIRPVARTFKKDSPYGKAIQAVADHEEKLMRLLGDQEKELFLDFTDTYASFNTVTAEENFIYGFKMGALMMLEVTQDKDILKDAI